MVRGRPARQRLPELARAVGAVEPAVEHHEPRLAVAVARDREIPDAFGGDRIVRGEAVHEHHAAPEEIQLALAQRADVRLGAHHPLERDRARDAELAAYRERERDVLAVLDVVEARELGVGDRGRLGLADADQARAAVAARLLEQRRVLALAREQHAAHGTGAEQRLRDVAPGRAHHVEMVRPGIADHPVRGAHDPELADLLEARVQRHALEHERFGAVVRGDADDPQLLDHVGQAGAEHRQLAAIGGDQPRQRSGRLRVGAHAVRAQRRSDRGAPRTTCRASRSRGCGSGSNRAGARAARVRAHPDPRAPRAAARVRSRRSLRRCSPNRGARTSRAATLRYNRRGERALACIAPRSRRSDSLRRWSVARARGRAGCAADRRRSRCERCSGGDARRGSPPGDRALRDPRRGVGREGGRVRARAARRAGRARAARRRDRAAARARGRRRFPRTRRSISSR